MFKTGSPVLQEFMDEVSRKDERKGERKATENLLVTVLVARFGTKAEALKAELKTNQRRPAQEARRVLPAPARISIPSATARAAKAQAGDVKARTTASTSTAEPSPGSAWPSVRLRRTGRAREVRIMSPSASSLDARSDPDPAFPSSEVTTVLVVDDSAFDRHLVSQLLESMKDVRVVYACDGCEGLEAIARESPIRHPHGPDHARHGGPGAGPAGAGRASPDLRDPDDGLR